jgi:hypothetical protein
MSLVFPRQDRKNPKNFFVFFALQSSKFFAACEEFICGMERGHSCPLPLLNHALSGQECPRSISVAALPR